MGKVGKVWREGSRKGGRERTRKREGENIEASVPRRSDRKFVDDVNWHSTTRKVTKIGGVRGRDWREKEREREGGREREQCVCSMGGHKNIKTRRPDDC